MQYLPFDVKLHIALFDEAAWYAAYRYDYEFNKYAHSEAARKQFIMRFTRIIDKNDIITYSLFNKLHQEGDLPALICSDKVQIWLMNGQKHRENDLPAVIYANRYKEWWYNGILVKDRIS